VVWNRRRDRQGGELERVAFSTELAGLEYLAGMPEPVAPRLLGADMTAGVLVMEELPPGRSLADSLLAGDRDAAVASLVAGKDREQTWPVPTGHLSARPGSRSRSRSTSSSAYWAGAELTRGETRSGW
jgi:hypothetical protein